MMDNKENSKENSKEKIFERLNTILIGLMLGCTFAGVLTLGVSQNGLALAQAQRCSYFFGGCAFVFGVCYVVLQGLNYKIKTFEHLQLGISLGAFLLAVANLIFWQNNVINTIVWILVFTSFVIQGIIQFLFKQEQKQLAKDEEDFLKKINEHQND